MAFRKATREGTKALIGLHGGSGAGKTFSALLLARGLVGPDGDIYMIETESGRGEMYAGEEGIGQYFVDRLDAPYSSKRYAEKIEGCADDVRKSGRPSALIIDSMSHEWEGIGGVVSAAETIAENAAQRYSREWNGSVSFGDWKIPKQDHKHMVLQMLGAPMHIIVCLRSQYKSRQIEKKDFEKFGIPPSTRGNSAVIRDEYQTPIQDANFIFEMTVHAELEAPTKLEPGRAGLPILGKCPDMLKGAFPPGKRISNETGAFIAAWCSSGSAPTEAAKPVERDPVAITESLIAAINKCETKEAFDASIATAKFNAAWDWIDANAPEKSASIKEALEAKRDTFG